MPLYIVEAEALDGPAATKEISIRFPEVAVERHYETHENPAGNDIWVCRAPSSVHVERWATALGLVVVGLRQVHQLGDR